MNFSGWFCLFVQVKLEVNFWQWNDARKNLTWTKDRLREGTTFILKLRFFLTILFLKKHNLY